MKTFITSGPITWASARMRAYWPAQYMSAAQVIPPKDFAETNLQANKGDQVIFGKQVSIDLCDELHHWGVKTVWDMCDPLWWWQPDYCKDVLSHMDAVVCSNNALGSDFFLWSGIKPIIIPDRLDMAHFPIQQKHVKKDTISFVWFGLGVNRIALMSQIHNLDRLACAGEKIELTIIDDGGEEEWTDKFPVHFERWSLETENQQIARHDIAVLPPYPGPWGEVKSNNRTLTAHACGLPVVQTTGYWDILELVKNHELRQIAADNGLRIVNQYYRAQQSAHDWEYLLCS